MMIEVNGIRHPVREVTDGISYFTDTPCKIIEMNTTYNDVINTFINGVKWSIIDEYQDEIYDPENDTYEIKIHEDIINCDFYSVPGVITDYRNGVIRFEMIQTPIEDILKMFEGVL